jgi:TonB family protein
MRKVFWYYLLIFSTSFCIAQTKELDSLTTFNTPEVPPKFPGGYDSLRKFVKKNLQWPKSHWPGRVIIEFNVNRDGSLSDFRIIRGNDSEANKEVIKLFEKMPAWIPGTIAGKPVKMRMIFPINISFD